MDVLMSKSPWSPEANFENACLRGVPNAKRRGEFVEKVSGEKRADAAMAAPKRLAGSGRRKLTVELFQNPAQPIDLGLLQECM